MKNICRNCGNEDMVIKDDKLYCPCCGQSFDLVKKEEKEIHVDDASTNRVDKMFKRVVSIQALVDTTIKVGTAFFISSKYAITNAHILFNDESMASEIVGKNYEGTKTYHFEVIDYDVDLDIALLESKDVSAFHFCTLSELVRNGEEVFAIGNSKGEGLCIVNGLVSDKNRIIDGIEYIMSSVLVTNGNSGGPLFNEHGFVIGMITMSRPDASMMNYALPSKAINLYLSRVKNAKGIPVF